MTELFLLYLALFSFPLLLALTLDLFVGAQSLKYLKDTPPAVAKNLPRVSVITAARNEEKRIEAALSSLLNQDYPAHEVIAIDDRSTDATGPVLDRLAAANPVLKVLHISELPPGWLGKNHALYFGAERASGDYFLFTDADVVMEMSTVRRAIAYLTKHSLDHLTLAPEVRVPGVWLNVFIAGFGVFFSLFTKPWKAKDPRSPKHIGIGAFNLIRASVYRQIGTHKAIALRPDDDLKLGKLVKKCGFRQDIVLGVGLVWVEWYASLRELIQGLMKNSFSGVDYRFALVPTATLAHFLFFVWPVLGVFLTSGMTRWMNLSMALMTVFTCCHHNWRFRANPIYALGLPFASLLFIYIIWRSTLTTLANGGINWRDTHYALDELRRNKV
jgi:glycosyltransferase involved in cell wall biosynthesis